MAEVFRWGMFVSQMMVLLAMLFCAMRLVKGPTAQDRVLALDTIWLLVMMFALLLGIQFASQLYFELAMLIALTGFVSTVALVKFLMRGEIIE